MGGGDPIRHGKLSALIGSSTREKADTDTRDRCEMKLLSLSSLPHTKTTTNNLLWTPHDQPRLRRLQYAYNVSRNSFSDSKVLPRGVTSYKRTGTGGSYQRRTVTPCSLQSSSCSAVLLHNNMRDQPSMSLGNVFLPGLSLPHLGFPWFLSR